MTEQQMTEEIDRLARLCEAKDAEIAWLEKLSEARLGAIQLVDGQLSEVQAQLAMQAEFVSGAMNHVGNMVNGNMLADIAKKYHDATSETVAAWRAKETEPLRREVAMLYEMMKLASVSLGAFCSDEGWAQSDMDTLDSVDAAIAATKATALAYEQEVENRGAVKALERIIRGGCDLDFIEAVLEEIRAANKGEVR